MRECYWRCMWNEEHMRVSNIESQRTDAVNAEEATWPLLGWIWGSYIKDSDASVTWSWKWSLNSTKYILDQVHWF